MWNETYSCGRHDATLYKNTNHLKLGENNFQSSSYKRIDDFSKTFLSYTTWRVPVFGVIQSKYEKILTRITPNTDTFYAVLEQSNIACKLFVLNCLSHLMIYTLFLTRSLQVTPSRFEVEVSIFSPDSRRLLF